jgi:hypothetical protein
MEIPVSFRMYNPFVGVGGEYITVGAISFTSELNTLARKEIDTRRDDAAPSWFILDHNGETVFGCIDRAETIPGLEASFFRDESCRRMFFLGFYRLPASNAVPPQISWDDIRNIINKDYLRAVNVLIENSGKIRKNYTVPLLSSLPSFTEGYGDSAWDKAAKVANEGKPVGAICVDQTSGQIKYQRAPTIDALAQKKTTTSPRPQSPQPDWTKVAIIVGAVLLGAMVAGVLARMIFGGWG